MAQSSTHITFQSSPCPALVSLVSHLLYPRACCQQWLQSSRDAHNLWCKRRFDSFGKRLSKLWVCVNPPFTGFTGFTMKKLLLLLSPLQSCPTLCNPIDGSPPGSSDPGIFQARILEWVAISFSTEFMSSAQTSPLTSRLNHLLHISIHVSKSSQI